MADVLGSAKRGPGRPPKSAAPSAKPGRPAKTRGRRSPEQIAETLETIVAYVKTHPNTRSEHIRKALKIPAPVMVDALGRLRDAKKLKMKGEKRAASYTVA